MKIKHISVLTFYDKQKRILLQDRRNMSKHGEEWGFFGGKIESGETKEEALVREIKEELTYDITECVFLGTFEGIVSEDRYLIAELFIAPLKVELSDFKQTEGQGMKLFTMKEARDLKMNMVDPQILNSIEEYLERNR